MTFNDVLIKPVLSEKATALREQNKYTFIVDINANKIQIKQAVEQIFKVKVKQVNTLIVKGKVKTQNSKQGRSVGRTSDYKKAVVLLTKESKPIEFFESLN